MKRTVRVGLGVVVVLSVALLPGCTFFRNLLGLGGGELSVQGTVYDATTNLGLGNAMVETPPPSQNTFYTDSEGHYAILLSGGAGAVDMSVTLAGYLPSTTGIDTSQPGPITQDVYLTPDATQQSDIAIDSVTAPAVATPSGTIAVSVTASNVGGVATRPSPSLAFFLSADAAIDPSDTPLGSAIIDGVMDPGDQVTVSASLVLAPSLAEGDYFLAVLYQGDAFAANNTASTSLSIRSGVDLVVRSISTAPVGQAGQTLGMALSVANQGNLDASSAFTVTIYLSADGTIDPNTDPAIGQYAVPALAAGSSSMGSGPFATVPATLATGAWYYGAIADTGGVIAEVIEDNNSRVGDSTVTIGDIDLAVLAFSPPATFNPGVQTTVPVTVTNLGTSDSGGHQLWVYISADNTLSGDDTTVASSTRGPLGPAQSDTWDLGIALPARPPGGYFLIAVADGSGQIAEPDETNNLWVSPIGLTGADLTITAATPALRAVHSGGQTGVTYTLENVGTSATGSFSVKLFLSEDSVLDLLDIAAGTHSQFALSPGPRDSGFYMAVPASAPVGQYRLLLSVDDGDVVPEMDEGNNVFDAGAFEVTRPDLYASNVVAPISAVLGTPFNVLYRVGNTASATFGGGSIGANIHVYVYLSTDPAFGASDILLLDTTFFTLPAIDSFTAYNKSVSIPAETPSGSYYVGVVVDPQSIVPELSTSNNVDYDTGAVAVTGPDLVVQSIGSVPGSVYLGQQFTLPTTIRNDGDANATAGYNVVYRWSADPSFEGVSYVQSFGSYGGWGDVPSGGTSAFSPTVTVPAGMGSGFFNLAVDVDSNGIRAETDEGNNRYVYDFPVLVNNSDYKALSISGPATGAQGAVIGVTFNVQNGGNYAVPAFSYRVYLSDNADPDVTGDTQVQSGTYGSILGSSQAAVISVSAVVPLAFPTGTFYLKGLADSEGTYAETNETNNVAVSFTTITITAP